MFTVNIRCELQWLTAACHTKRRAQRLFSPSLLQAHTSQTELIGSPLRVPASTVQRFRELHSLSSGLHKTALVLWTKAELAPSATFSITEPHGAAVIHVNSLQVLPWPASDSITHCFLEKQFPPTWGTLMPQGSWKALWMVSLENLQITVKVQVLKVPRFGQIHCWETVPTHSCSGLFWQTPRWLQPFCLLRCIRSWIAHSWLYSSQESILGACCPRQNQFSAKEF